MRRLYIFIIAFAFLFNAQGFDSYIAVENMARPGTYLPLPPDTASLAFATDYNYWIWGKSVRNSERGTQASWESKFGIVRMATVFGEALGITIDEETTPAIYNFMGRVGTTGCTACTIGKSGYFRSRPFIRMHEDVWGMFDEYEDLRKSSSYPSSHATLGWSIALALAEMAPHLQDTILRRGFQYGESRVIVGAHWKSDIDAAQLVASAALAVAHTSEEYHADLLAARAEYMAIKGLTQGDIAGGYPSVTKVLDLPPTLDDYRFYGDLTTYWQSKEERNSERGDTAVHDASLNDDDILNDFAPCIDIAISDSGTPSISMLMRMVKFLLGINCSNLKDEVFRRRPYVQFGDRTSVPVDDATYRFDSSYPSGHAMIGWGIALTLVEVMPDCQEALLKRGYEFGRSREITGFHYASDVLAGRIMAACALTKLHNETLYNNLLEQAKSEYALKKAQGIDVVMSESTQHPTAWYTLAGIILPSKPTQSGIYIHNGRKVVVSE